MTDKERLEEINVRIAQLQAIQTSNDRELMHLWSERLRLLRKGSREG